MHRALTRQGLGLFVLVKGAHVRYSNRGMKRSGIPAYALRIKPSVQDLVHYW
jgi:hypothetical protein